MRFDPKAGVTDSDQRGGDDCRRRTGRLHQEAVTSNIGKVLDLSATGMRVLCRRKLEGRTAVSIRGLGAQIAVFGRVAWVKKRGMMKYETGIEFVDVPPDVCRQLSGLALTNRERRAI
jgi:hypothetical protein